MSVVISPSAAHTASVIFLHGLGDSGHGWESVMRIISKAFPFIKFILPHAPSKTVTLNGGMKMPSWYDIKSLDENGLEDEAGMLETRRLVENLVEKEKNGGISLNRIIVGGFSQGGVIGLLTGLTGKQNVAAVISLSAYLPLRKKFASLLIKERIATPIFMSHGTADFVVNYRWGKHSSEYLNSLGCNVSFNSYPNLDHSFNEAVLEDLKRFIRSVLETDSQLAPKAKEVL